MASTPTNTAAAARGSHTSRGRQSAHSPVSRLTGGARARARQSRARLSRPCPSPSPSPTSPPTSPPRSSFNTLQLFPYTPAAPSTTTGSSPQPTTSTPSSSRRNTTPPPAFSSAPNRTPCRPSPSAISPPPHSPQLRSRRRALPSRSPRRPAQLRHPLSRHPRSLLRSTRAFLSPSISASRSAWPSASPPSRSASPPQTRTTRSSGPSPKLPSPAITITEADIPAPNRSAACATDLNALLNLIAGSLFSDIDTKGSVLAASTRHRSCAHHHSRPRPHRAARRHPHARVLPSRLLQPARDLGARPAAPHAARTQAPLRHAPGGLPHGRQSLDAHRLRLHPRLPPAHHQSRTTFSARSRRSISPGSPRTLSLFTAAFRRSATSKNSPSPLKPINHISYPAGAGPTASIPSYTESLIH